MQSDNSYFSFFSGESAADAAAMTLDEPGHTYGDAMGILVLVAKWIDYVMSLGHLLPYDLPGFGYRRWLDLSQEIESATRQLIASKRAAGATDHSLLSMLIRARNEDGSPLSGGSTTLATPSEPTAPERSASSDPTPIPERRLGPGTIDVSWRD